MTKKTVNIREVAQAAGVSAAAVSYALKGDPLSKLSESRREHILRICKELNYYPNEHARRMFSRKADTVALFFPPVVDTAYQTFIDQNFSCCLMGTHRELARRGMDLLLVETSPEFIREQRYMRLIHNSLLDGILLWGTLTGDRYVLDILKEKFPVVMLQSDIGKTLTVTSDDTAGARMLAERVFAAGHRKIAVVPPLMTSYYSSCFLPGILNFLKTRGDVRTYVTKAGGFEDSVGVKAVEEILSDASDTTCIMAPSDVVAWSCVRALAKRGIRVPEDMSVTGAGGFFLGTVLQVDSFRIPSYQIGVEGVKLLCDAIEEKKGLISRVLPVEMVEGDTLKRLPSTAGRRRKEVL